MASQWSGGNAHRVSRQCSWRRDRMEPASNGLAQTLPRRQHSAGHKKNSGRKAPADASATADRITADGFHNPTNQKPQSFKRLLCAARFWTAVAPATAFRYWGAVNTRRSLTRAMDNTANWTWLISFFAARPTEFRRCDLRP